MLKPGDILDDRYRVLRALGEGGIGAVYQAEDTTSNRDVVVKEIAYRQGGGENWAYAMQSLRAEVGVLTVLHHPSLVRVRDYFDSYGQQFLVMDFAPGRSIERIIQDALKYNQILHAANIAAWADQLCAVLHYLHAQEPPIIYCDLKPSNAVIDDDLRVRLIDFGTSFSLEAAPNGKKETVNGGTPHFAPVEQFEGNADGRSDIYALGACLYCLLTRTIPPTAHELAAGAPLPLPSQFGVNPGWDSVIGIMLAVKKEKRYRTIHRTWQELHALFRQLGDMPYGKACPHCSTQLLETATACYKCCEVVVPKPSSTQTTARVHAFITGRLQPDHEGTHISRPA